MAILGGASYWSDKLEDECKSTIATSSNSGYASASAASSSADSVYNYGESSAACGNYSTTAQGVDGSGNVNYYCYCDNYNSYNPAYVANLSQYSVWCFVDFQLKHYEKFKEVL